MAHGPKLNGADSITGSMLPRPRIEFSCGLQRLRLAGRRFPPV
jgi:hypothetical protein